MIPPIPTENPATTDIGTIPTIIVTKLTVLGVGFVCVMDRGWVAYTALIVMNAVGLYVAYNNIKVVREDLRHG